VVVSDSKVLNAVVPAVARMSVCVASSVYAFVPVAGVAVSRDGLASFSAATIPFPNFVPQNIA